MPRASRPRLVPALLLLALGCWPLAAGGREVGPIVSTPNAPILPDNGCLDDATGTGQGGIADVIVVPGSQVFLDVEVELAITHSWRSDLQVAVDYSGSGTGPIRLVNNHDGSGDNYYARLGSQATVACSSPSACGTASNCSLPGTASWCSPDESLAAIIAPGSGVWTLSVCDRAAGDTGTLVEWRLDFPLLDPVELTSFTVE